MEKKHNSCPAKAYEKFSKTITASSFLPNRRISNHHNNQDSIMPSNPAAASSDSMSIVKPHHHHTSKHPNPVVVASEVGPIKFDNSDPQKYGTGARVARENRHKATRMESSNKMNANIEEDEFTKYIKHAWNKIRNPKSVGDGKNGKINASATEGGGDTGKDHFSDYINRTKKKMLRTMSSFVGGRKE